LGTNGLALRFEKTRLRNVFFNLQDSGGVKWRIFTSSLWPSEQQLFWDE